MSINGYTYCVTADDGFVKIGQTVRPDARLSGLQTGNPRPLRIYGLIEGIEHESRLHSKYEHLRVSGEWFKACDEILAEFTPIAAADKPLVLPDEIERHAIQDDGYGGQELKCPVCPDSPATVEECYWDTEVRSDGRYGGFTESQYLRIVCEGVKCRHVFELSFDVGENGGGLSVRRIVHAKNRTRRSA